MSDAHHAVAEILYVWVRTKLIGCVRTHHFHNITHTCPTIVVPMSKAVHSFSLWSHTIACHSSTALMFEKYLDAPGWTFRKGSLSKSRQCVCSPSISIVFGHCQRGSRIIPYAGKRSSDCSQKAIFPRLILARPEKPLAGKEVKQMQAGVSPTHWFVTCQGQACRWSRN